MSEITDKKKTICWDSVTGKVPNYEKNPARPLKCEIKNFLRSSLRLVVKSESTKIWEQYLRSLIEKKYFVEIDVPIGHRITKKSMRPRTCNQKFPMSFLRPMIKFKNSSAMRSLIEMNMQENTRNFLVIRCPFGYAIEQNYFFSIVCDLSNCHRVFRFYYRIQGRMSEIFETHL